jgi:hypothetical protein
LDLFGENNDFVFFEHFSELCIPFFCGHLVVVSGVFFSYHFFEAGEELLLFEFKIPFFQQGLVDMIMGVTLTIIVLDVMGY